MAIRIVKPEQAVKVNNITIIIYGPPSSYKTTTAMTASKPLLIDLEDGMSRAMLTADRLIKPTWQELMGITADDLAPYDTIVFDTIGALVDTASIEVGKDPKMAYDGIPNQRGWGKVKAMVLNLYKRFKLYKKDILFVSHTKEKASADGGESYRLDAAGTAATEIIKDAHLMGRIKVEGKGIHIIEFSPDGSGHGKNPAQFGIIPVPTVFDAPSFMADLISQTKMCLNEDAVNRARIAKEQQKWNEIVNRAADAGELTDVALECQAVEDDVKPVLRCLVAARARVLGLTWDKAAGVYISNR